MCKYLADWMKSHRYFVERASGYLIRRKGLTVEDYMYNVVQPHVPLDEIGVLLYARMYKIHVAVILERKYWTTNRDETLKRATLYLVYLGKMKFNDTTRKGSWPSSLFQELPSGNYQLRSHGPIDEPTKAPVTSRTTLNSMQAGLTSTKDLQRVKCEYDKMHLPRHKPTQPEHVPDCQKAKAKRKLHVQVHRLQVRKPRNRALKCPVCGQVFHLIKEVDGHVKQAHPKF